MVAEGEFCSPVIEEPSATKELNNNVKTWNYEDSDTELDLTPIQKFYSGANVLITGSTGFLGKILVEKLLRSCPTISTLYLIIRNKKGKPMEERLDDIFNDIIFERLQKESPKFRHKIIGISGDCSLPDCGISINDRQLLKNEINIVFHVAATVRFDEKLKTAVAINIRSVRDLLYMAKDMTNLKAFIHVSTLYANCVKNVIEERVYPTAIESEKLLCLTENLPDNVLNDITPGLLDDYPNTYAFTKQIAEDVVKENSEMLPAGIFRPAIVVSTYKEPINAWISNLYGPTGVCAGAGVGLLRALNADVEANANLVPVDMCVNSMIACAWEVGENFQKAVRENKSYELRVYNYESSNDQPITWGTFMDLSSKYGIQNPTSKAIWYYCFNLYRNYYVYWIMSFLLHTIPAILTDIALVFMGKKRKMMKAYSKIHKFSSVISYFAMRSWVIRSSRVQSLCRSMSEKDSNIFFSDLKQLNWDEFFHTYLRGVRVYLIGDPIETLPKAKRKWLRLWWAHQILKTVLSLVLIRFGWAILRVVVPVF